MAEKIVAYAVHAGRRKAILANYNAPRPEYFGLVKTRDSYKRFYAATVKAVARRLAKDGGWPNFAIEWQ